MDQLIELLKQIQELAGVGVDALKKASGGDKGGAPEGGKPGAPDAEDRADGGRDEAAEGEPPLRR
jgi:hypothetical protein